LQLQLLSPLFVLRRHPRAKRRIPVFAFAVALAFAFLAVIPSAARNPLSPVVAFIFYLSSPKVPPTYSTPNPHVVTLVYSFPTFNTALGKFA